MVSNGGGPTPVISVPRILARASRPSCVRTVTITSNGPGNALSGKPVTVPAQPPVPSVPTSSMMRTQL